MSESIIRKLNLLTLDTHSQIWPDQNHFQYYHYFTLADAIGLDKMDDEKDFKFRSQIKRRNECLTTFLLLSLSTLCVQVYALCVFCLGARSPPGF